MASSGDRFSRKNTNSPSDSHPRRLISAEPHRAFCEGIRHSDHNKAERSTKIKRKYVMKAPMNYKKLIIYKIKQ